MRQYTLSAIAILAILASCVQYPDEPEHAIDTSNPAFEQTGYSTLRITDDDAVFRTRKDVSELGFGIVSNNTYSEELVRVPGWKELNGGWQMQFSESITLPAESRYATIRLRKYLTGGSWIDMDHVIATNKYPYAENAFICAKSIFGSWNEEFQDIAVAGGSLFAVNMGPTRLWRLEPGTNTSSDLYTYGAGDNLTGTDDYLFVDVGHSWIERWNAQTLQYEATIKSFDFFGSGSDIRGLSADGDVLYALVGSSAGMFLVSMGFDGTTTDSIQVPLEGAFYLAARENILYTNGYRTVGNESIEVIDRFDLTTKTFLSSLLSPVTDIEGMEIVGSAFYYVDYGRGLVCNVRLSDLKEVEAVAGTSYPDQNIRITRKRAKDREALYE